MADEDAEAEVDGVGGFDELIESGEAQRILLRVPGSWRSGGSVNSAFGTVLLQLWEQRERSTKEIMADVDRKLGSIPGYRAFCIAESGLLRRSGQPVQFVLTGSTYEELAAWRDVVIDAREVQRFDPVGVIVFSDRLTDLILHIPPIVARHLSLIHVMSPVYFPQHSGTARSTACASHVS